MGFFRWGGAEPSRPPERSGLRPTQPQPTHEQIPPFWRNSLFMPHMDSVRLIDYGIACGQRGDGPRKLAAGWAIWDLGNIGTPHAFDFIREGYELWSKEPGFIRGEARSFLAEMRGRLLRNEPPGAHVYDPRCWAGIEFLKVIDANELEDTGSRIFDETCGVEPMFLSSNEISWAREYASAHGLPEPWSR